MVCGFKSLAIGLARLFFFVPSPKTDEPRCMEPVRIYLDLCERKWWGDVW